MKPAPAILDLKAPTNPILRQARHSVKQKIAARRIMAKFQHVKAIRTESRASRLAAKRDYARPLRSYRETARDSPISSLAEARRRECREAVVTVPLWAKRPQRMILSGVVGDWFRGVRLDAQRWSPTLRIDNPRASWFSKIPIGASPRRSGSGSMSRHGLKTTTTTRRLLKGGTNG
jgi:hypothetical protein